MKLTMAESSGVKLPVISLTPAQTKPVYSSEQVTQTPSPYTLIPGYNSGQWNRTIIYYKTGPVRGGSSAHAIMRSGEDFYRRASEALFVHATYPQQHHRSHSSSSSSTPKQQPATTLKHKQHPAGPPLHIKVKDQSHLMQRLSQSLRIQCTSVGREVSAVFKDKSFTFCFILNCVDNPLKDSDTQASNLSNSTNSIVACVKFEWKL